MQNKINAATESDKNVAKKQHALAASLA